MRALFGLLVALLSPPALAVPRFIPLGDLPGGGFESVAADVSDDGSVVVGYSRNAGGIEAFRWTQAGGMVGLGALHGTGSRARAVSGDGSIVVGSSELFPGITTQTIPFRWTQAGGMSRLLSNNANGGAFGISSDGSVIAGHAEAPFGGFLWSQTNGVQSQVFPSGAQALSSDGSFVVGGEPAFRCEIAVECNDIALGPEGRSQANAVSVDGSVVVGYLSPFVGSEGAFRWIEATGALLLDNDAPGGSFSQALGVSADGSVVVGSRRYSGPEEAFIWLEPGGMKPLGDFLISKGLDLQGLTLESATAVSANGKAIVGYASNSNGDVEAWLAIIPEPGTALLLGAGLFGLAAHRADLASKLRA